MQLDALLKLLLRYRLVVVSGVQRSVTHIMARIVAEELGWEYVTDTDYNTDNNSAWAGLVLTGERMAVQCPHMTHMMHLIPEDVAAVWMSRPLDEVRQSFERVNPGAAPASFPEQMLYYSRMPLVEPSAQGDMWNAIREMYWEGYQRVLLGRRGITFEYHELEEHPLFCKNREGWAMNQVAPDG